MNRYTLIALIVGLAVGGLIGYQAGSSSAPPPAIIAAPVPPSAGIPTMPGAPVAQGGVDAQQRIAGWQSVVARDPKNVRAWISLGNDYFDTHQAQKAVEAYSRALELDPNNADVLTDQGVMYRELKQFDKAIANFQKAAQVDPRHVQSLFNLGVVYAYDLKDAAKAEKVWNEVVQRNPMSPQATQAQQAIADLRASPPGQAKK